MKCSYQSSVIVVLLKPCSHGRYMDKEYSEVSVPSILTMHEMISACEVVYTPVLLMWWTLLKLVVSKYRC